MPAIEGSSINVDNSVGRNAGAQGLSHLHSYDVLVQCSESGPLRSGIWLATPRHPESTLGMPDYPGCMRPERPVPRKSAMHHQGSSEIEGFARASLRSPCCCVR